MQWKIEATVIITEICNNTAQNHFNWPGKASLNSQCDFC